MVGVCAVMSTSSSPRTATMQGPAFAPAFVAARQTRPTSTACAASWGSTDSTVGFFTKVSFSVGQRVQPLTAPVVMPATMCFCAAKNSTTAGRMVSVM